MAKIEGNILVIDDDADVLTSLELFLKQHFTSVKAEQRPQNINSLITADHYDVVLLDMNFKKGDSDGRAGLYWLEHILGIHPATVVIMMTAYGEVQLAVQAIKKGATDFVVKPWKNEKLLATIMSGLRLRKSTQELEKLRGAQKKISEDLGVKLVGESAPIQRVLETIEKVAGTDANVLILGENGTGKEVVARMLHKQSNRGDQVFVSVDLGAIHENLFESELFGTVKGAYTDANADKPGRFELASGGTLFLDEIGNLSVPLQAKLLRVLQSRQVMRLGSNKEHPIDIRLICATNMPLYDMVYENKFRQDLLYRINTVELRLPALRERADDIPLLVEHFLGIYTRKYNKSGLELDRASMQKLTKYQWPGNIRELQHAIERAVILSDGNLLTPEDFLFKGRVDSTNELDNLNLTENEKQLITKAIDKSRGNISQAAKELGITRTALYRRLEKYGL